MILKWQILKTSMITCQKKIRPQYLTSQKVSNNSMTDLSANFEPQLKVLLNFILKTPKVRNVYLTIENY